ncbi:hypothetical protein [Burkholderia sp. BCC0322]|uniref:hypothetical protein n=1 Tax=unclassified Burkholderia TaxID=2613784 RepID=UPI00158AD570|nr:hypothetical protein [Burkholderia sp. BCC0322]
MEARIPDAQRIAPELMSPIEQAFLAKVGRSGVSDTAVKFALMVVTMLSFVSWQTLFLGDIAKRVGLSRQEVAVAASELMTIGAFERRLSRFAARKLQSFRLCKQSRAANRAQQSTLRRRESESGSSWPHVGAEFHG